MMNVRRVTQDFQGIFITQVLNWVISFITTVVIIRVFGPEGKGRIALAILTVEVISLLLTGGVDLAIMHFSGSNLLRLYYYSESALGLGLFLGSLGAVISWVVLTILSIGPFYSLLVLSLASLLRVNEIFVSASLRVVGKLTEENAVRTLPIVFVLIFTVLAKYGRFDVSGCLLIYGIGSVFRSLIMYFLAYHYRAVRNTVPKFNVNLWKRLLSYGIQAHLGSMLQVVNYRFDFYLVALFLGSYGTGIYSVITSLSEILWFIPNVIGVIIMQRSAIFKERFNACILHRLTSCLLFGEALIMVVLGPWLLRSLFGELYTKIYPPMLLLLPGIWALGLWKNLINELVPKGKPFAKSYSAVVAFVITLVLDLTLIPQWELKGAALASSLAYMAAFVVAMMIYLKVYQCSAKTLLVPGKHDLSVAWSAVQFAVRRKKFSKLE